MKTFHVEQSLPLCCSLAALGGVLEVAATAVTAVPAVREKQGIVMKWWVQYLAIAGNVALQAVGSLFSHLIATWFGPVSLVVPFFYSATLLSNMLIFGLLGERFTKNMRVGTHVIVVAVILLPVVGPNVQKDQDISNLFRHWYAIVWFVILLLACATTGLFLIFDVTKYHMKARMMILLVARATAISVNLTVSRAFILGLNDAVLMTFVVIKIVSGAIYTYGIVVQSYAVEQARFVPLNATTIIIVNALTGIIIWQDWRVVSSWYGYLCIFVLLGLGCDLLLSVPLLNSDNPEYGTSKRASMIIKPGSKAFNKHLQYLEPYTPNYDSISERKRQMNSYSAPPANGTRSRSRVDAWKDLVSHHEEQQQKDEDDDYSQEASCQDEEDQAAGSEILPISNTGNAAYVTPQRVGDAIKETTILLAYQPIHLGEKLAKAANGMMTHGSDSKDTNSHRSTQKQNPPAPKHLTRRDAWREIVSPVRGRPTKTTESQRQVLDEKSSFSPPSS